MIRHRILLVFTCLLPLAVLCVAVNATGVDVLRWDEWMVYGNLIERVDTGTLDLGDIAAQQNEQRLASARVFGLALMPLTHLDRFPEYWLNVGLAMIIFGLTAMLYARTSKRLGLTALWPYPAFACLAFSLCQWEGFTMGISNTLHMPVLCMLAAVLLLENRRLGPGKLLLLAVICFAGSFHFANGLFGWFCLAPLILAAQGSRRARAMYLGLWLLAAAATWVLYFRDFQFPPHHPSVLSFMETPWHCAKYFFTYLGSPIFAGHDAPVPARAIGMGGVAMLLINGWVLLRGGKEMRRFLLPWLCVAGFTLLSALSTSVGRGGYPLSQAMESRYVTFSTPLWFALAALGAGAMFARKRAWLDVFRSVQRMVFMVLVISFVASAFISGLLMHNRQAYLVRGRQELFRLTDNNTLARIFPDSAYLKTLLPRFFERRLTVFRHIGRLGDYVEAPADPGAGLVTEVRTNPFTRAANDHGGVRLRGWAADPATGQAAAWVLVTCNGRIAFATTTGLDPANADAPQDAGFEVFLPWFFLDPDAQPGERLDIQVLAVAADGRTVYRLDSARSLRVTVRPWPEPEYVYDHFFLST